MEKLYCSKVDGKELSKKQVIAFILNNRDNLMKDEGRAWMLRDLS